MDEVLEETVRELRAGVDVLLAARLDQSSGVELVALLETLERERRRLAAVGHRVIRRIDEARLAGAFGACSTTDLVAQRLRVTPGEARERCAQAAELAPSCTLSGEPVPALLPATGDALHVGDISPQHVAVISRTMRRVPDWLSVEAGGIAERVLVTAARHEHPKALERTAAMLLHRLDPDGQQPTERERERNRGFTLSRARGTVLPTGEFTDECAALWTAILDSLAAPAPADNGDPDERTPAQRRHDAMREAALRLLRSGDLPHTGGVPVTVLLHLGADDVRDPDGLAVTSDGSPWPLAALRPLLGDAAVVPVVFDHDGAVLACGRARRLASEAQRLALAARDRGCCFPGCTRPPAWTQAHHVTDWADGGATDVDNLCLLCAHHHRSFAAHGWRVAMVRGVPYWTPPPWLDPDQRPVRNTAQHPPDLDLRALGTRATLARDGPGYRDTG